jgi:large subunit ribosomal protein L10
MLRTEKERIVAELADQLSAAETLIVADYRGLTNKQLEALRDVLLEHGARFRIVKNTLTRQAAERAGAEALLVMLEGPTAIAFIESNGDPAAVAKALAATSKETNVLALRGGIFEGQTISSEQLAELATLPPVDVLRAQLVGAVVAPLTQLLALVSAPLRDLHGLVEARIKQLEEQGQVVEPAESAELVGELQEARPEEPSEPGQSIDTEIEAVPAETDAAAEEPDAADTPAGSATVELAAQDAPAEQFQAEETQDAKEEEQ